MPSELQPGNAPAGLLSGLVQGYHQATSQAAKEALDARVSQRESMLQYLGQLAANPNIPPEHQQWALQKIQEGLQHDISKKPWEVKLSEMPPVMRQPPPNQAVSQAPGMTLQMPTPPGGASSSAAPAASASPEVGKASNGTVNALGGPGASSAIQMPSPPIPPLVPPGAPQTAAIPPSAPTVIQNPQPPQQIAPGGAPHITTAQERSTQASDIQKNAVNELQKQYPGKSPEDLAYFSMHGEFPKDEYTLGPGQKHYKNGQEVASNDDAKPGAKSGYEPVMGPAGIIGVKDVATGGMLTPEQVAAHPDAKAVLQQATSEHERQLKETEQKEGRLEDRQARSQARAFQYATTKAIEADAIKASRAAAPMVSVLDTSEKYMQGGQFTPRQDLAMIVRAVRAMNPGTVRLPQTELALEIKAGSYGDRFRRWFDTATAGTLPNDQREDLMNVIREETTTTASSAADNWQQAYGGAKPLPTHLQRFASSGQGQQQNGQIKQPAAPNGGATLPPEAAKALQEGHVTTFANGQKWTLQNGQPKQVQ